MEARCPICRREIKDRRWRPFCSERCRMIDLDNWLAGRYLISTPVEPLEGEDLTAVRPETGSDGD